MVQLLGMVLDFIDALVGAVAIAWWWCNWVRPKRQMRPRLSERAEIDHFLREARIGTDGQETESATSRRPTTRSDVAPYA